MAHTDHARPARDPDTRLALLYDRQQDDYHAHLARKHKRAKANVDMHEQLRDLDSERDYYTLATVGVHRPWPGAMALWECELLNHDTPGCCRTGSDVYATSRTPGYDVGFDVYYLDRAHMVTKIEPVIEDKPMSALQRKWADEAARKAARKERKRKEALEARKRTLTDEERRAILRRESIGLLGFSRM